MTMEKPELLAGLVAWWRLNEASGNRYDAHTGIHILSDGNTVLSAAGQMPGLAADFEKSNSEYLSAVDATWNTFDNESVAWWGWFKAESYAPGSGERTTLIGKWDDSNDREYGIWFRQTRPIIGIARGDHVWITEALGASGILGTATWYFGHWYYNATTNVLGLKIYNTSGVALTSGTASNSTGMGPSSDSVPFYLGRNAPGGAGSSNYWDGLMQQFGCGKVELTENNVQWLINDGNGRDYAELLQGSMPLMF